MQGPVRKIIGHYAFSSQFLQSRLLNFHSAVVVTNATCLTMAYEIRRGKGLDVRLSLAITLSTMQETIRFSSFPPHF
ncbi:hypothetical protein TNCV_3586471 [Trichonephila clavipes]|nr:hypothetical protein TNCV_3586471 [Trichonephila clavipes]